MPDAAALEQRLEPDVQVVALEEVQFFDEPIVSLCQHLANRGMEVIVAGLDQDFRGLPFAYMPILMALADNVIKLHAICKVCGGRATRTQRLINGRPASWKDPTILIGAEECYEARCRQCHKVRNAPGFGLKHLLASPPRTPELTNSHQLEMFMDPMETEKQTEAI